MSRRPRCVDTLKVVVLMMMKVDSLARAEAVKKSDQKGVGVGSRRVGVPDSSMVVNRCMMEVVKSSNGQRSLCPAVHSFIV